MSMPRLAIAVLELRGMSVGPGDGHAHGSGNPHYWLDPKNAEIITATILEALARIDPANAANYEANRRRSSLACRPSWRNGRQDWRRSKPCRSSPTTTAGLILPAASGWILSALSRSKPGVPPSPSHLAGIVRTMRARGVRIVVREPHEPERDVAFVAGKAGAAVVTLAASVGALPGTGDYIALFDSQC